VLGIDVAVLPAAFAGDIEIAVVKRAVAKRKDE
jgi:hypothetical protein